MNKFTVHTGKTVPLYRQNIDTDQIMPKQFLTRIERTGFGKFLFYDWRFDAEGAPRKDFVLNDPRRAGASILLAGANFGCGSSREHAPWGLTDHGFRAVVASGFADIFYNNAFKNGLLPVVLSEKSVAELVKRSEADPEYRLTIDLVTQTVSDAGGFAERFEIDEFRRFCLMNGLDEIGLTLQNEEKIIAYEAELSRARRSAFF